MKKANAVLLLLTYAATGFTQGVRPVTIGDEAPAFKVAHWLKGEPGGGVEQGKVNVVEFWATWCAPCIANFPHLSKLAIAYQSRGVDVFGISVSERKGVDLDSLKRFVAGPKGQNMHYVVGADDSSKYMATHWQRAAGRGGIPFAMIVDKSGKIAWFGHPMLMDKPLEQIVNGTWDLTAARRKFSEDRRLDSIDNSIIPRFNDYLSGKNPSVPLAVLDSFVAAEPALKYRQYLSHYRIAFLLNSAPEKAVAFARQAWAANDFPDWKGVSDMVYYRVNKKIALPPSVYVLGAEALQAQIDTYPWSMDIPATYSDMAAWYFKAGDKAKAQDAQKEAIEAARKKEGFSPDKLKAFEAKLQDYEK